MIPSIPADVRERIEAAANDLYEQAGRERFPAVDAVRRVARVDMNAASAVMREWRKAQTAQAAPVALQVPEAVQQASQAALAAMWQQATELANESLRRAQAAWDAERQELDDMRAELAEAYESQAAELEALKRQLAERDTVIERQAAQLVEAQQLQVDAQGRADLAETRAIEIERSVAVLRSERDAAIAAASEAREQAARLGGQLEAMQAQNTALLAAINPAGKGR